jgi:hypothetical protein
MTNSSGPRKNRNKYNPLNKQGTVKTRQDFIEAEYVNGVYDSKGNERIRPMTKEEIEWLSRFYQETEHSTFQSNEQIRKQEALYKQLCRDFKAHKKYMSFEESQSFREKVDEAYNELVHLRSETNTFYPDDNDRREIYTKSNRRREDIFNRAKVTNNLISLDLPEFDQFTSRAEKDISGENLVLDYLKKPVKKVVRRRRKKS